MMKAHRKYSQICRERLGIKKYGEVYNPHYYLYEGFNQSPPQRPKSKAKNKLEWFAILVFGAVAILILLTDKGVMR